MGDCKKIDNTSGVDYFVPTKTTAEWDSFAGNLPSGVTVESCVVGGTWTYKDCACGASGLPACDTLESSCSPVGVHCYAFVGIGGPCSGEQCIGHIPNFFLYRCE